jgi:hypothetical protein
MSAQIEFNAQMYVSEQLTRQLVNTTQDVAIRCVHVLAEKYEFDAEEAIQMLGLLMIKLERKAPEKVVKAKAVKAVAPKSAFPLPYNGEFNDACCYALRQNNGLYTQCTGVRKGENTFCKGCASQMQKMGAEMPEYGTIQQRMAVGIMEYVDPKGRKPIAYAKIMKKYKIDEEQVLAEAGKFNINIDPIHFVVSDAEGKRGRPKAEKAPKEKGAKGRPKKSKKVLQIEGDDEDLFAALVAEANEVEDEDIVMAGKKKGKSDEEKEAERLAKEAEKKEKEAKRLAEKAEKEAKLAAEKAEKEAKKKAEEEARAAKKAAEEAEKQAKKEAAEKAKAEKEAKLAAEKAEKEAAKEAAKAAKKPEGKAKAAADPEPDDEPDVVKKIEFEGKKYLKSKKTGIVYDYNKYIKEQEQVVVGKWSESANKIIFDDAEESEEEYDM